MIVRIELQNKEPKDLKVEGFNLSEAVKVINGEKVNDNGNPLTGFMIGSRKYVRALDVVSIEIIEDEKEVSEND